MSQALPQHIIPSVGLRRKVTNYSVSYTWNLKKCIGNNCTFAALKSTAMNSVSKYHLGIQTLSALK